MIPIRHSLLPGVLLAMAAGAVGATPLGLPNPWAGNAASPSLVPVFDERVDETLDLPTWELQQARRAMLDDQPISWDAMRALADAGDGLAAFRFAQRIEAENDPALLPEAAFYYATAAYTNRDYAVPPLVRLLERRDLAIGPRRLEHMENALRAMALAGDARAKAALTRFYATGHPFGVQPERAMELRLDLAEAGDADAAMALVLEALSPSSATSLDAEQVGRLLEIVEASDDLGLRTTGANLRRMFETGAVRARSQPMTIETRPMARPAAMSVAPTAPAPAEEATP